MAKSSAKKDKLPSLKKEFRSNITEQLKKGLTGLEEKIGKKEFESRVKKAAKLLTAGIKMKPVKAVKEKATATVIPAPAAEKVG